MTDQHLNAEDYPVAETQPERVTGARGRSLEDITLDGVMKGDVTMEDLRITPEALLAQAQIAKSVGRSMLAANFERASEMTQLPQEDVVRIYELLRPGRAGSKEELRAAAEDVRTRFSAERLAVFIEEAADLYERRGLYRTRF